MCSIVNGFIIVVCAGVSLSYSSEVITNANWVAAGESSTLWYDVTCGTPAIAVDKSGTIYVSQWDLFAGGQDRQTFAKWDHHQWTTIVPGIESEPICSMVFDTAGNMYAGGRGGFVQKFDGVEWQKIGKNLGGLVLGLAINNRGELFAGTFGIPPDGSSFVYKWNDTAWVTVGEIPNGHVNDLACDSSGNLIVCGKFDLINGIRSGSVAKWDGNTWSSLDGGCLGIGTYGDPFVCEVNNVKCIGNNVYIAGEFDSCGSKNIHAVAKWDGSTWSNVGKGTASSISQLVTDQHGNLFASGYGTLQDIESYKAAKLINDEWVILDSLDTSFQLCIIVDSSGSIFGIGGNFSQLVDGKWSLICNGEGFDANIYAFAYDQLSGYLYAGGEFSAIGNKRINNIARWDGKSWSNLGNGISLCVKSLAVGKDGTVYAGGSSCSQNSRTAITAWNGESWTDIAQFKEENSCLRINALVLDSVGNLYAAGEFSALNDTPLKNIARWDGKSWSALEDGIDGLSVNALAIDKKGTLYAGGDFDKAGTEICHNIARWDGTAWSSPGDGVKKDRPILERVNALVIDTNGNLYAGGGFSLAGDIDAVNIAKWNGESWSCLGSDIKQFGFSVNALSFDENGNLYAGGDFQRIDSLLVNNVARWNGTKWEPLGDGTTSDGTETGFIYALSYNLKGTMYTGGNFTRAGGKISCNFAQCNLNGPLKLTPPKNKKNSNNVINKRNDGLVLVRSDDALTLRYRIYSLSGREVNYEQKTIPAGEHVLQLKTKGLARGAYIADIRAGDASLQYRFVVR